MKKPEIAKPGPGDPVAVWADEGFVSEYPDLYHMLVDTRWDDGSPRETATLLLFVDAGRLKAALNDRATSRVAWATADNVVALLGVFDDGLRKGTLDWRGSNNSRKGRR